MHMSRMEMTIHSGILSPFLSRIDKWIKRKEDMSKGMMHEGCKMNEKMKLKRNTKTSKNAIKYKVNITC